MNAFKEELGQIEWIDVLQTDDLETSCESFIGTVNKIKEIYNKPFKNRLRVTYLGLIRNWDLMKKRDFALKIALKSKSINDGRVFKVVNELRKAKANFFMTIIKEGKGNSKLIWKNINKLTKTEIKDTDVN